MDIDMPAQAATLTPLTEAKQRLYPMLPDDELRSFTRWFVIARQTYREDPRFFSEKNNSSEALLYTTLVWIYGGRQGARC